MVHTLSSDGKAAVVTGASAVLGPRVVVNDMAPAAHAVVAMAQP